jgi:hypothetical protein
MLFYRDKEGYGICTGAASDIVVHGVKPLMDGQRI